MTKIRIAGALVGALLLSACGIADGSTSAPSPSQTWPPPPTAYPAAPSPTPTPTATQVLVDEPPRVPGLPSSLVGAWSVSGQGIPSGTVIRIGDGISRLGVSAPGCWFDGDWKASLSGSFVAYTWSASGAYTSSACPPTGPHDLNPRFLNSAVSYVSHGSWIELHDASGVAVARLDAGGKPVRNSNAIDELSDIPKLTETLRQKLDAPAAGMPAGVDLKALLGRWVPNNAHSSASDITFNADGSWSASDGCNGTPGRYALVAATGEFLAVAGSTTLVGCVGDDTSPWFVERIALVGSSLLFIDSSGVAKRRFVRPEVSTPGR